MANFIEKINVFDNSTDSATDGQYLERREQYFETIEILAGQICLFYSVL